MQSACALLYFHVDCLAVPYFSTLSHKQPGFFKKKKILNKMQVLIFSTTFSETYLILRGTERYIIKKLHWSSCTVACYGCQILIKLEFSRQIFEKYSNIKFMTIHPVGAEMFHADGRTDGRTDMTKLIVAFLFCNFAKGPKNVLRYNSTLPYSFRGVVLN